MLENALSPEALDFFKAYRLQLATSVAISRRIMKYVLYGNKTKGITPIRRADIVRQLQIEWNGQRVDYLHFGDRTGVVLYVAPLMLSPRNHPPRFEAYVRWDKPLNDRGLRTSSVGLNTLRHIEA